MRNLFFGGISCCENLIRGSLGKWNIFSLKENPQKLATKKEIPPEGIRSKEIPPKRFTRKSCPLEESAA